MTDPPPVMERLRPALRDLKDLDPAIASLHHRKIQPSRLLSLLDTMRKVRMRNTREESEDCDFCDARACGRPRTIACTGIFVVDTAYAYCNRSMYHIHHSVSG